MTKEPLEEIAERLARLRGASGNGATSSAPHADDLDWFLFHSFPGCDVEPTRFASLLPLYERALAAGTTFDFELLFVRLLELRDAVPAEARCSVARSALRRAIEEGFDPADAIAAIRFAIRVLPDADAFLDRLLTDEACARLRFHLTVDFVLDERELDDYLALSYLREGDPDAASVLEAFPLMPGAQRRLATLFEEGCLSGRLEEGWSAWTGRSSGRR
jgi:hypothetical protein